MIFLPGKIYYTHYTNYKHDPNPIIFVLYSDFNKTHSLNLRYFSQPLFFQFGEFLRKFKGRFNITTQGGYLGGAIYNIIKQYFPLWIKTAYRTYKTQYLTGYLISEGITQKVSIPYQTPPQDILKREEKVKILTENFRDISKFPPLTTSPKFAEIKTK